MPADAAASAQRSNVPLASALRLLTRASRRLHDSAAPPRPSGPTNRSTECNASSPSSRRRNCNFLFFRGAGCFGATTGFDVAFFSLAGFFCFCFGAIGCVAFFSLRWAGRHNAGAVEVGQQTQVWGGRRDTNFLIGPFPSPPAKLEH